MQTAITDLDQYQPSTDAELRFPTGQAALGEKARAALDQIAGSVKDQRAYIIEVQGFAPGNSQASIASSQKTGRFRCCLPGSRPPDPGIPHSHARRGQCKGNALIAGSADRQQWQTREAISRRSG